MSDLVSAPVGKEGAVSVKFEDGKLVLELAHNHASGTVKLVVTENPAYFLDKLAAAIPGVWDDAAIAVAKQAIAAL